MASSGYLKSMKLVTDDFTLAELTFDTLLLISKVRPHVKDASCNTTSICRPAGRVVC